MSYKIENGVLFLKFKIICDSIISRTSTKNVRCVVSFFPVLKKIQTIRSQESRCIFCGIPLCFPAMTCAPELFSRQWLYVRAYRQTS